MFRLSLQDKAQFDAIAELNVIKPETTTEQIDNMVKLSNFVHGNGSNLAIDEGLLILDREAFTPNLTRIPPEYLQAFHLAQVCSDEPISYDQNQEQLRIALAHVRGRHDVFNQDQEASLQYLRMLSAKKLQDCNANVEFNRMTDSAGIFLNSAAIISVLGGIQKITMSSMFGSAFAKGLKKDDSRGISFEQLETISSHLLNKSEFIEALLLDKDIDFNPEVHKRLTALHLKKYNDLRSGEAEEVLSGMSIIKYQMEQNSEVLDSNQRQLKAMLKSDKVLLQTLAMIDKNITHVKHVMTEFKDEMKAVAGELKAAREEKQYMRNIQGYHQAISTIEQVGVIFHSPNIQKTAALLNQGLNLSIGVMQLTNTMPKLDSLFGTLGTFLGPVGTILQSALAIGSLLGLGKKKKKDDPMSQALMAYYQALSEQIHQVKKIIFDGVRIITDNQRKQWELTIECTKQLESVIYSDGRETRNVVREWGAHLNAHLDSMTLDLSDKTQILHLQAFNQLMIHADLYIEEKQDVDRMQVKLIAKELENWIMLGGRNAADSLHTGYVDLAKFRGDISHHIKTHLADADKNPDLLMKNIGLLAGYLEQVMKIPLENKGEKIDPALLPNPMIWSKAVNKYIEFSAQFSDMLDNKEAVEQTVESTQHLYGFISLLQNKKDIYIQLLEVYKKELDHIKQLFKKAAAEKGVELFDKIKIKIEDKEQKTENLGQNYLDVSKPVSDALFEIGHELTKDDVENESFTIAPFALPNNTVFTAYVHLPFSYANTTLKQPFALNEFYKDCKDSQSDILQIVLLNRLKIAPVKIRYQIEQTKPFLELGMIRTIFSTEKSDSKSQDASQLFRINFKIIGDDKGIYSHSYNDYHIGFKEYSNGDTVLSTGIDSDFAKNTKFHSARYNRAPSRRPIWESEIRNYLPHFETHSLIKAYLAKKVFEKIEPADEFKNFMESTYKQTDDFFLEQRKIIIGEILCPKSAQTSENHHLTFQNAIDKLDLITTLIKAFASLAGITNPAEPREPNNHSVLPGMIAKLPDGNYIKQFLANYIKNATIKDPWPLDHLGDTIPAIQQIFTTAEPQKPLFTAKEEKPESKPLSSNSFTTSSSSSASVIPLHFDYEEKCEAKREVKSEPKSELNSASPIFVSYLQIQLELYQKVLSAMNEKKNKPIIEIKPTEEKKPVDDKAIQKNELTAAEIEKIKEKIDDYTDRLALTRIWFKRVKTSSSLYPGMFMRMQQLNTHFQKILPLFLEKNYIETIPLLISMSQDFMKIHDELTTYFPSKYKVQIKLIEKDLVYLEKLQDKLVKKQDAPEVNKEKTLVSLSSNSLSTLFSGPKETNQSPAALYAFSMVRKTS